MGTFLFGFMLCLMKEYNSHINETIKKNSINPTEDSCDFGDKHGILTSFYS